ncbi:ion transporter [Limnohabitans sp. Rim8]|uniref:ion transporter n=1 Tax=Limnohabitans sp. Rim8 TaxID=1100718 RepID=UPI0025F8B17E|nr:ion transporter [Limnohabitans sp. Rim8]
MNTAATPNISSRSWRQAAQVWLDTPIFQRTILALIVINAVILGLETSTSVMQSAGRWILLIDQIILAVFVAELSLRLFVHRLAFWRDPWSVFDFSVVAIALVPATGPLAVLRALRVLRVLRMLTIVPSMRRVVGALLSAIPGLSSIALVLLLVFYVFGVIATHLFGALFPDWFGHLGRSLYTLFQVMTLESWSMGIARPVMEQVPWAWTFFILFILFATFTMLNLFIAIIVNAMQTFQESEHQRTLDNTAQEKKSSEQELHQEVKILREELREIKTMLSSQWTAAQGLPPRV